MRRVILQTMVLILCLVFGGCGQGDNYVAGTESHGLNQHSEEKLPEAIINSMTEDDGYYDIQTMEKELSVFCEEGQFILGVWYEGQAPVWLVGTSEGSVYSYRIGEEKELVLEGISPTYVSEGAIWRKVGESYYVLNGNFLVVLTEEGELDYRIVLEKQEYLRRISTTESGRIVVAVYNRDNDNTKLMELDIKRHELVEKDSVQIYYGMSGGTKDSVRVMSAVGLYDVDINSGEKSWYMRWKGTTYDPTGEVGNIYDIRCTEEGKVILLVGELFANKWLEKELAKVSFEELGKHILVYRTSWAGTKLKEVIAEFNKENTTYYVYLDEKQPETDYADFVEKTGIEIATGKGPDIIDISSVENICSLAKKGVFEDLQPYMQKSGMQEDAYFPVALRDFEAEGCCYGLTYGLYLNSMYMKEEYATGVNSIETLLDELEGCEDAMVFCEMGQYSPRKILYYFLRMSEDMHGMLDWENGTCDFSGELWKRMLEVAKRYGVNEHITSYEGIANEVIGGTFQDFGREDFRAREEGMIPIGYPLETATVNQVYERTLCMNAKSEYKEGVWEFLEYVMSPKGQEILSEYYFAVLKSEFEKDYQEELTTPSIIGVVNYDGIYTTREQVEKIAALLENARQESIRTEYVWSIIHEETEHYFNGENSIEQVTEIIENRVSMYMAENR